MNISQAYLSSCTSEFPRMFYRQSYNEIQGLAKKIIFQIHQIPIWMID